MWDHINCFVCAAEAGSFSGAASRLNTSVATVSRRINALERNLGLRLLDRQVTGVSLTAEGSRIYNEAVKASEHMARVTRLAAGMREGVDIESVVVSSTEPVISEILAPRLPSLWQEHPQIRPTLTVSTANVSISQRDADIAIRLARPTADNLVIKRLPKIGLGLYASAGYLGGRDLQQLKLNDEVLLGWDDSFGEIPEVTWFSQQRLVGALRMLSSSARALCHGAKAGAGIALLPDFIAEAEGLIRVPAMVPQARTPYLVFHRDYRSVKRVKIVRDWIVTAFDEALGR